MPRSLAFCFGKLRVNLGYLTRNYGKQMPSAELVQQIEETCLSQDVEAIFEAGLHEFIQDVLNRIGQLGQQIQIDYRFNE